MSKKLSFSSQSGKHFTPAICCGDESTAAKEGQEKKMKDKQIRKVKKERIRETFCFSVIVSHPFVLLIRGTEYTERMFYNKGSNDKTATALCLQQLQLILPVKNEDLTPLFPCVKKYRIRCNHSLSHITLTSAYIMENLLSLIFSIRTVFKTKTDLVIEIIALRQQLAVMKRSIPRPKLRPRDRIFWVVLSRVWRKWNESLIIVKPDTVVKWHKKGFKLFWRWKSRPKGPGRPAVSPEIRNLVRTMAEANPLWGAPKIHGELLKLGIEISETTISNLLPKWPRKPPSQTWRTFLKNHIWNTCSIDFFTVPTATFKILFVLVILSHDRRKVLHFNVTTNPTAEWTSKQIVEAFPYDIAPKYLIRRDCLDHVIVFNERHLNPVVA